MILRRLRARAQRPVSLRGYLVTGSAAVVVATFTALVLLLWAFFIRHFQVGRVNALLPRAAAVAHLLVRHAHAALLRVGSLARAGGGDVWLVGRHGGVLRRYPRTRALAALSQWVTAAQMRQVLAGHALAFVAPARGLRGSMAVVGDPVRSPTAVLGTRAVFWLAPVGGAAVLRAVGSRVALVAAVGLGVAVTLFAWLAERVARPVRHLEAAARRIAGGAFDVAVAITGPAEVRSLAASLSEMELQLGEVDRQRREFLADVSHELRSPLTALRGALEGMRGGTLARAERDRYLGLALAETARLTRLVDDLLVMARIDSGRIPLHRVPVDIWEALLRVALSLEPMAALRQVRFRFGAPPEAARVDADPDRLSQVLWNLLYNAARHAPPDAEAYVCVAVDPQAVSVTIANPGPPISGDVLARLFDRFEQGGGEAEGSSGLGLAIARALAEAHGGTLAAASPPEGGLRVTLRWPRSSQGAGVSPAGPS